MIASGSRWLTVMMCGFLLAAPSFAQEIRPFESGSLEKIVAEHKARPFVLALWSLTCPHCAGELEMLGDLSGKYPDLDVVLVSTDTPQEIEAIAAALKHHRLGGAETWVFADAFTERLRFEIDRQWQGELPRIYFYDAGRAVETVTGKLRRERVERWIQQRFAKTARPAP